MESDELKLILSTMETIDCEASFKDQIMELLRAGGNLAVLEKFQRSGSREDVTKALQIVIEVVVKLSKISVQKDKSQTKISGERNLDFSRCLGCGQLLITVGAGLCETCGKDHDTEDLTDCDGENVCEPIVKCDNCGTKKSETDHKEEIVRNSRKKVFTPHQLEKKKSVNCPFLIRNNMCKKNNKYDFNHRFDIGIEKKKWEENRKSRLRNPGSNKSMPICRNYERYGKCTFRGCKFRHEDNARFQQDWYGGYYQNNFPPLPQSAAQVRGPHPGHYQNFSGIGNEQRAFLSKMMDRMDEMGKRMESFEAKMASK